MTKLELGTTSASACLYLLWHLFLQSLGHTKISSETVFWNVNGLQLQPRLHTYMRRPGLQSVTLHPAFCWLRSMHCSCRLCSNHSAPPDMVSSSALHLPNLCSTYLPAPPLLSILYMLALQYILSNINSCLHTLQLWREVWESFTTSKIFQRKLLKPKLFNSICLFNIKHAELKSKILTFYCFNLSHNYRWCLNITKCSLILDCVTLFGTYKQRIWSICTYYTIFFIRTSKIQLRTFWH